METRVWLWGAIYNINRKLPSKEDLEDAWDGENPNYFRTELPILPPALSEEDKRKILATAESREDFHDYKKMHDVKNFGCLCELQIASGKACEKHLGKGLDGKTTEEAKYHWAWHIGVTPRGLVCPIAYTRHLKGFEGCDILIFNEPHSV